jgi:WD40 repeat protein
MSGADGAGVASAAAISVPKEANAWTLTRTLAGSGDVFTPFTPFAFSPDGSLLALGGGLGIRLWDAKQGQWSLTLEVPDVCAVAFDREGRLASASAGDEVGLRFWDIEKGTCLWRRKASTTRIAFSPDGERIACLEARHEGAEDGAVRIVHTTGWWKSGQVLRTIVEKGAVGNIALSPDGKLLATSERDGGLRLFDLDRGVQVRSLQEPTPRSVQNPNVGVASFHDLAFSPSGRLLASLDHSGVRLWDVDSGVCLHSFGAESVKSIAFSREGSLLAGAVSTKYGTNGVRLWDVEGRWPVGILEEAIPMEHVAFSPTESVLVSIGQRASLWLWTTGAAKGWGARTIYEISAEIFELDRQLNSTSSALSCEDIEELKQAHHTELEACKDRLTEIGNELYAEGGEELMRRALSLAQQLGLVGRYVERHWSGIGGWMG